MPGDPDPRDAIHAAIQQHATPGRPAVLTGWVVVAEWMDETGCRWLTRFRAPPMTSWAANSLHHEALYGDWPDSDN